MRRPWLLCMFLAAFVAAAPGCAVNPATGEGEFSPFVSPEQERQIGAAEHPKVIREFGGAYDEAAIAGYVAAVGGRLAAQSELPAENYTFTLLDSPIVNAFALPGGYVYITRGLLALANNEAELAGVLGHEIGHVTGRHTAQRINRAVGLNLGLAVLGAVTGSRSVAELGQFGSQAYLASFSRDQEFEADLLGVRYMRRAGYPPIAQAHFLDSLNAHSEFQRKINGQVGQGFDIFATHPRTPDRVNRAIQAAGDGATAEASFGRDRYLDAIDGMIFGDGPEQGYARGRVFAHPVIGFRFEVPEGFRLINTPGAVLARDEGEAVIVFDQERDPKTARAATDMARYLAEGWAGGVRLSGLERIDINGMPAATALASGNRDGKRFDLRLVAARFDSDTILRFLFLYPSSRAESLGVPFRRTTYSLRRLSQAEIAALKPLRIRVITVAPGDTRTGLARRMALSENSQEWFDILNALAPGEQLRAGARVKIVAE